MACTPIAGSRAAAGFHVMRGLCLVCVTLALTAIAASSAAQQPLTLADAQAEARAHAPEVAQLEAVVRGAEAVAAQASRRFRQNPDLTTSYFNGALIGRPEERSWTASASLPVDVSGSWKSRAASAGADLTRAQFDHDTGLRALDEQVAVAVAEVALQQRLVARSQRIVELQMIAADAAHRQLDVGQGTQLDADSADLDLGSTRAALEQARGGLAEAQARLSRLLGRDSGAGLAVADPAESLDLAERPDFIPLIDRDPRVRAAHAEVDAAMFERETYERLVAPAPTFGLNGGYTRSEIPQGSFRGLALAAPLSATWPDRELVFTASLPLPFFDRQQEPRARATARLLSGEADMRAARATVHSELESTWAALDSATRAAQAVANVPALVDRDADFVEQAVRAGAFDAVMRTQALRRLLDAGRAADTAVRDLRVARAAWVRRTAP
jgi:outer membrane protein, heavy metal efflux system